MIDEKVLIERLLLESAGCKVYKLINPNIEDVKEFNAYKKCIEIVNQLSEEHGKDTNVLGNNGWIPCSERLPEDEQIVLVQLNSEYQLSCEDETPLCVMKYEKSIAGFSWKEIGFNEWHMDGTILAWQPLPAPYKQKEGKHNE